MVTSLIGLRGFSQPSLVSKSQDLFRGPHYIKEQDDLSNLQRGKLMGKAHSTG
jgi:hypothetical protein